LLTSISIAPPPTISEVFYSAVNIFIEEEVRNITGHGFWISDQPAGKNVELYNLQDHIEEHLYRWDLHTSFNIISGTDCDEEELDGDMPPIWGWMVNATFSQEVINGEKYDTWSVQMGYAQLTLALDATGMPKWFLRSGPQRTVKIQFLSFVPSINDPAIFNVPKSCPPVPAPSVHTGVGCTDRTTMISRAEDWVSHHVPYNQGATYGGYREDCSGYVSMCWGTSKPGYTTFTMPSISKAIKKADLLPGDVLLCTTEHVVLFGGWADASHTQYTAYEETRPGEGTVKRVTPYPYWYNQGCFVPHRYNSVC